MAQQALIIGVTGGIASGKSTVARGFAAHGIPWVDADDVAREVVAPGTPALAAIANRYGDGVLDELGALNRRALRQIVFADDGERRWLESVTHPRIRERLIETLDAFRRGPAPYALLISPLLLESGQVALVDRVLVIDVPESVQIARTMQRDGVNETGARSILAAQISRRQRLQMADDVLDNSGDHRALSARIDELDCQYRRLSGLPSACR